MKRTIALLLVTADFLLLAAGSRLIWGMRDQGYAGGSPSSGAVALGHFVGAFPFGPALFVFGALLLAAMLIYPWLPRVSGAEVPKHSQPGMGIWPPPPAVPDVKPPKEPVHHWSRPDKD